MASLPPLVRAAAFSQILTGSYEPVANALSVGLFYLLKNPIQTQMLAEGTLPWMQAVDEVLRISSPFRLVPRIARNSLELHGKLIQPGERILLMIAAANKDPSIFPQPNIFDVTRSPNRHIAFGLGSHSCLGARLARLQLSVGLSSFFARFPSAKAKSQRLDFVGQLGATIPREFVILLK
jgi:cytochrome P450